jgi:hypothetical protein
MQEQPALKRRRKQQGDGGAATGAAAAPVPADDAVLAVEWGASELAAAGAKFRSAAPFPHLLMPGLLRRGALDALERALRSEVAYHVKENDLFSFRQSSDLAGAGASGAIAAVVRAIYSESFRSVVSSITGAPALHATIDLTSSVYGRAQHLLCHDDELSTRRIAYILYLVPEDWCAAEGGTLDLFTVDSALQPNGVLTRVVPQRNTLLLFEVCDRSYHQVAEVLGSRERLTIGGWFHGPRAAATPRPGWTPAAPALMAAPAGFTPAQAPLASLGPAGAGALAGWVNAEYLSRGAQKQVSRRFEEDSCVQLQDFLRPERAVAVGAALEACQRWRATGPYQKQRVDLLHEAEDEAEDADDPQGGKVLREFVLLLRSDELAQLLGKLTGVAPQSTAVQLRRFAPGCYSLAHDRSDKEKKAHLPPGGALDLCWTWVTPAGEDAEQDPWDREEAPLSGGQLVYCAEGEMEPLLVVTPAPNMLTLVFRAEPGTQSFVKYVNQTAPGPRFDASAVYWCEDDA